MGKKSKKQQQNHRHICQLHAASEAVKVLEAGGLRCVITGQLAVKLHGGSNVPTAVALAVLPGELQINWQRYPNFASNLLINTPGQVFQCRGKKKKTVTYYDPTASELGPIDKRQCIVTINKMDAAIPGFRASEVQRLNDLPVISILPLLVYSFDTLQHDPNGLKKVMRTWEEKEVTPIEDEGFKILARSVLARISDDAGLFQPFFDLCQKQIRELEVKPGQPPSVPISGRSGPSPTQKSKNGFSSHAKAVLGDSRGDGSNGSKLAFVEENIRADAIFDGAKLIVETLHALGMRSAILGNDVLYNGSATPESINVLIFHPADASVEEVWKEFQKPPYGRNFHFQERKISKNMQEYLISLRLETVGDSIAGSFLQCPESIPVNIFTPETAKLAAVTEKDVVVLRQLAIVPNSCTIQALTFWHQASGLDGRD